MIRTLFPKELRERDLISKNVLLPYASDFHNILRDIFLNGVFEGLPAYQEVPLWFFGKSANCNYGSQTLYVDWYLPLYRACFELNGGHHDKPVKWASWVTKSESELAFISQQRRDERKRYVLEENGFNLFSIPYKDKNKMNESYISNLLRSI